MYQLEVKRYLVEHQFPPPDGWKVTIDVDPMERATGGQHRADKQERARRAEEWLVNAGAGIGTHPDFGRADLVAAKPGVATVVVEVEGDSSRQKEQALYSALGQTVVLMRADAGTRYGLAVPDTPSWERQMAKIPTFVCDRLSLTLWLVGRTEVRELAADGAPMSTAGARLFLVSCVKTKQAMPAAAMDLYTSNWFKKARACVEKTGCPWRILSAKYGLVHPEEKIGPYEKTLGTMRVADRRAWADRVLAGLRPCLNGVDTVVFLAGQRYREFLEPALRDQGLAVRAPMSGLRQGEQLAWLDDCLRG